MKACSKESFSDCACVCLCVGVIMCVSGKVVHCVSVSLYHQLGIHRAYAALSIVTSTHVRSPASPLALTGCPSDPNPPQNRIPRIAFLILAIGLCQAQAP